MRLHVFCFEHLTVGGLYMHIFSPIILAIIGLELFFFTNSYELLSEISVNIY